MVLGLKDKLIEEIRQQTALECYDIIRKSSYCGSAMSAIEDQFQLQEIMQARRKALASARLKKSPDTPPSPSAETRSR